MTYIVAWKMHEGDDEINVYPLSETEFDDFKKNIIGPVYRYVDPNRQIRKTVENHLVGFVEAPVLTLETINGLIHISGIVWRI